MVKLLHLCRITYNLQNQGTPNRFGVTSICLQVAIFQNDISVCNRPEKRMTLRSLQPLSMKLAKSHISAEFFVRVYVLGWYTYFETPQVLFSFVSEKRGSKLWEFMNDIHEVHFKNFLYFLCFLKNYWKKYCCLTHKRRDNWTRKFNVTK